MQSLADIKVLLATHGLTPRKAFGQNFLIDHNLIRKLVDASGVGAGDVVLEVGPGTGTLTEELLARGCVVIAAEIDRGLVGLLRERFGGGPGASDGQGRFVLVEGDCLDGKRSLSTDLAETLARQAGERGRFTLVSNLPYGAGTPLMAILLADHPNCDGLFVTIQKEVADRLAAGPGGRDYGPISVLAQATADVESIAVLPPECFWPRPEVTSRMIAIRRRSHPLTESPRRLLDSAQRVFEHRRKQLGSVLGREFPWPPGVVATSRAEQLSVQQFVELASRLERREQTPR